MRWRLLWIVLISLWAVGCHKPSSSSDRTGIEKEKLADDVLHRAVIQLQQETELHPCGTMGQMLREIQVLGLSFYYFKPIDIASGRELLLKGATTVQEKVNQEPRIHPYLSRYPFTPRNVEIEIFLRSPDGGDVPPGALRVITVREGTLHYKIAHPKRKGFLTIYKETYEEALARLQDPSLPLASFEPDRESTPEEIERLRSNVSLVADDGSIWRLGPDGSWIKAVD